MEGTRPFKKGTRPFIEVGVFFRNQGILKKGARPLFEGARPLFSYRATSAVSRTVRGSTGWKWMSATGAGSPGSCDS